MNFGHRPVDLQRIVGKLPDCVQRAAAAGKPHVVALAVKRSSARNWFACDAAHAIRWHAECWPVVGNDSPAAIGIVARKIDAAAVEAIADYRRATAEMVRRRCSHSSDRSVCLSD